MGEAFSSLPSWPCLPYPWLLPMPSPRLKPRPSPNTTMVERRMDLTTPTTEDMLPPMDNTTEETDTTTRDTTDTMDSTTDFITDSTTPVSKPKAGNQFLF